MQVRDTADRSKMTVFLAMLIGLLAGFGAIVLIIMRQLSSRKRNLPVTAEWIYELSADRYRPMLRLLDESDLKFLKTQPGYDSRTVARLRAQRCQIFRGYLKCLNADFQ